MSILKASNLLTLVWSDSIQIVPNCATKSPRVLKVHFSKIANENSPIQKAGFVPDELGLLQ